MSKVINNIPVFFLLLAWLVMFGHQIIPHDHHLSESVTYRDDSCPFSKNKSNHHPVFPVHCHAFNDLTSEKAITLVLCGNIRNYSMIVSDFTDVFAFDLQQSQVIVLDFSKPVTDSYFLEFSHLRAPPALI